MPVKDRLAELQKTSKFVTAKDIEAAKKAATKGSSDGLEMIPLSQQAKGGGGKMSDSCSNFLLEFQEVIEDIDRVEQNVKTIDHLHTKILTDFRADPANKEKVEDLMDENRRKGKRIRLALQQEQDKLDQKAEKEWKESATAAEKDDSESSNKKKKKSKSGGGGAGDAARKKHEWRMRRTQIQTQTARFSDIWLRYNQVQLDYREKSKKSLSKQLAIADQTRTEDEIEQAIDSGKLEVFSKSILEEAALARKNLSALEDRRDEFLKLERSIVEIHDLFQQVAGLVKQQGEVIDNIARYVDEATIDVEKGKDQLKKAEEMKTRNRKLKIIVGSLLALVIFIVVMVILGELGAFSGGGEEPQIIYVLPSSTTSTTTTTTSTTTTPVINASQDNATTASSTTVSTTTDSGDLEITEQPIG